MKGIQFFNRIINELIKTHKKFWRDKYEEKSGSRYFSFSINDVYWSDKRIRI